MIFWDDRVHALRLPMYAIVSGSPFPGLPPCRRGGRGGGGTPSPSPPRHGWHQKGKAPFRTPSLVSLSPLLSTPSGGERGAGRSRTPERACPSRNCPSPSCPPHPKFIHHPMQKIAISGGAHSPRGAADDPPARRAPLFEGAARRGRHWRDEIPEARRPPIPGGGPRVVRGPLLPIKPRLCGEGLPDCTGEHVWREGWSGGEEGSGAPSGSPPARTPRRHSPTPSHRHTLP